MSRLLQRLEPAPFLVALVLLIPLAAGCGGGDKGEKEGGDGKTSTAAKGEDDKTRTGPRGTRPGPPPKPGTVLKNLNVVVASRTQAKITLTLSKASELTLQVRRASGQRVGRVPFGEKPAGTATISWNLRVDGKQLPAGSYKVQMRGRGAGKSNALTIRVPS